MDTFSHSGENADDAWREYQATYNQAVSDGEISEDETRELVAAKVAELGISEKRDMGKLMKAVLGEHQGTVDGKLVSRLAGELLN